MSALAIRPAERRDLEAIVALHAADALGGHGDGWTSETAPAYEAAFAAILASPDTSLFVAERDGAIVGTFQTTLIPCLTGRGAPRAKLEAVQVRADARSGGIGAALVAYAEAWARARGADFVELTSNAARLDAHRFYLRLGYAQSHLGFKKRLR